MSLKAELDTWAAALEAYDADDLDGAMRHFRKIADTSKVCWNIGIILATLGRHEEAVEMFNQATTMDQYFTIAYQQKGVSNFVSNRKRESIIAHTRCSAATRMLTGISRTLCCICGETRQCECFLGPCADMRN